MSKKNKRNKELRSQSANAPAQPSVGFAFKSPISRRGWKIIGIGVATVTLGFIVLSLTDPRGQNFASFLSPLLIMGGYTTIGFGILAKDPLS
jgi:hypothetical protein